MTDGYYDGMYAHRDLDDGRELVVFPLTYGRARIAIGPKQGYVYDDVW